MSEFPDELSHLFDPALDEVQAHLTSNPFRQFVFDELPSEMDPFFSELVLRTSYDAVVQLLKKHAADRGYSTAIHVDNDHPMQLLYVLPEHSEETIEARFPDGVPTSLAAVGFQCQVVIEGLFRGSNKQINSEFHALYTFARKMSSGDFYRAVCLSVRKTKLYEFLRANVDAVESLDLSTVNAVNKGFYEFLAQRSAHVQVSSIDSRGAHRLFEDEGPSSAGHGKN